MNNIAEGTYKMTEKLTSTFESNEKSQDLSFNKETSKSNESINVSHEHVKNIDQIRKNIENQSVSKEDITNDTEKLKETEHHYITKKLKDIKYQETLSQIRNKLSTNQKRFSNLVHQPTIDSVSEIGAKTVARPSGIIGGSSFALVGSIILIFISNKIGFEFPQSIFILLFCTGFFIGLIIELVAKIVNNRLKNQPNR